jgi:hypothetical protein
MKSWRRGSDSVKIALPKLGNVVALIAAIAFALVLSAKILGGESTTLASRPDFNALNGSPFPLATSGAAAAMLRSGIVAPPIAPAIGLALADFTGDTHPDVSTVELDRFDSANVDYWIEIQLTEGSHQFLKLTAPFGGLRITPRDVTGDGNLDLVVRAANSDALLAVYLNDGSGHFSPAEPAAFAKIAKESHSDFGFTTEQPYFGATFVCSESYTLGCRSGSLRDPQGQDDSPILAKHDGPLFVVLTAGSNRAPPASPKNHLARA